MHIVCVRIQTEMVHTSRCGYDKLLFSQTRSEDAALRVTKKEVAGIRAALNGHLDAVLELDHKIIVHKYSVVSRYLSCGISAGVDGIYLGQG